MSTMLTLDQLIAQLQALKASGVDGATPVVYFGTNDALAMRLKRVENVSHGMTVRQSDLDKGGALLRWQKFGGTPVVAIE